MYTAFDTIWPSDSVEFCPANPRNIFVCGTYKLDPSPYTARSSSDETEYVESTKPRTQLRRGKCMVFEVTSSLRREFCKLQEISLPGVLDMKWCHRTSFSTPILGIADSEGNTSLHEWIADRKKLELAQSIPCASSETLCLSLDWSNRRSPSDHLGSLVVSLSDGYICLLQPKDKTGLSITDKWAAHEHEPWIAAWNYWDTNIIYTGGDDLKMKAWDIRQGFNYPMFVNKRFDAGITTIQSHPHVEHLIAVGSYDNSVHLFDVRKPLVSLIQADVGGGAWRVKWHPSARRKNDLLVACMHDAFKIVRFDLDGLLSVGEKGSTNGKDWVIVKRFDVHESLAYGVDWSFDFVGSDDAMQEVETLIASGSFYDHALHLWSG